MAEMKEEKRIIAIPFAYIEGMNSGANMRKETAFDYYLQNICVAAASAKHCNPRYTVALVTNLKEESIPSQYTETLRRHHVQFIERPYDRFLFPLDYRWALAFYKLCALSYLTEMDFDKICYLDADVYVQGSLDDAWKVCTDHLVLYDIAHGKRSVNKELSDEIKAFLHCEDTDGYKHFGGEFFMANEDDAKRFVAEAQEVYRRMIETGFRTMKGDEFILCIVGKKMDDRISDAGSYTFRFWTGWKYRLVHDIYRKDPVAILHLPDEKVYGLPYLYRRYIKKGKIPENRVVWKKCRLNGLTAKDRLRMLRASLKK